MNQSDLISRINSPSDLISRINSIRDELGLSQYELAEALGILPPSVSRFFKPADDTKLSTAMRYAQALGYRLELVRDDAYVTTCCKVEPVRKGRADMRCPDCGRDVTLEMVLLDRAGTDKLDRDHGR